MRIVAALCLLVSFSTVSLSTYADENPGFTVFPHFGKTKFDENVDSDDHIGIGVGYRFDSPWGIEFTYQGLESHLDSPLVGDADVNQARVDGLYHFDNGSFFIPYITAGVGISDYDYSAALSDDKETSVNAGAGFKWYLSEKAALRAEARVFTGDDNLDNQVSVGLQIAVGGTSYGVAEPMQVTDGDADRDGITDSMDQCPGTPAGVEVDSKGCPLDDDGDGVANHNDDCPNTTNRRARVDASGCYVRLEEQTEITLNVEFDFDSAEPRDEHTTEVSKVADFMEEYPKSTVVMEGHTDDRGPAAYNQKLSEDRAKAIADMLTDQFGINDARVSSRGHGESEPVASNDTDEGRQHNRRVVAVVEGEKETIEMKQ